MQKVLNLRFERPLWVLFAVMSTILTLGTAMVFAAADIPATTAAEQDPEARAILMKAAEYIAKLPSFSVTLRSSYDAIQDNGQYIEFGEKRNILLHRPDRLRVETERSDGEQNLVLFDGEVITAFKEDDNVYAMAEKPGTVDDALVYMVRDLQFTLPMARLLHTGLMEQIEKRITAISYVEENTLFDVVTDHLAVRTEGVDMQLWVAQGDEPLPRRIVLTYMNAPGQPQFRGDFTDWSLAPKFTSDSFVFTPPTDAEKIPVIVRANQKGSLPVQKGGE